MASRPGRWCGRSTPIARASSSAWRPNWRAHRRGRHGTRVARLVEAIAENMAPRGVLKGRRRRRRAVRRITARYLALAATELPDHADVREAARTIVLSSAKAAWDNRADVYGLPCSAPSGIASQRYRAKKVQAERSTEPSSSRPLRSGIFGAGVGLDADGSRIHGVDGRLNIAAGSSRSTPDGGNRYAQPGTRGRRRTRPMKNITALATGHWLSSR